MDKLRYSFIFILLSTCFVGFTLTTEDYDDEDYDDEILPINSTTNGTLTFTKTLQNITRDAGKLVKLVCEVENTGNSTNITFLWRQNSILIEPSKRINVKTIKENDRKYKSTLKISKLDYLDDRGNYDCIASNGIDKVFSQAFLEINTFKLGATVKSSPRIRDKQEDLNFGEITTFLPNSRTMASNNDFLPPLPDGKKLQSVIPVAGGEFDLPSGGTDNEPPLPPSVNRKMNLSEPFCQIYTGSRCKELLEGKYVFVQPSFTQQNIEDKLNNAFLVISQSNDISSSCSKYAYPSMCYSAFPLCVDPKYVNTYQTQVIMRQDPEKITNSFLNQFKEIRNHLAKYLRRICKDDCILLETEICPKEYAIAKRHPIIGEIPKLEECEHLPDEIDGSSRNCLGLGVDNLQNVNKDDNCYWDQGRHYMGIQDHSISGKKCLRWSHQFHIPMSDHPELSGHNYCRNPGNIESQPFCFIDQNRKETCGINKCAHIVAMYIAIGFVIMGILLGFCIAYFCCKKRQKCTRNLQSMSTPTADKNIYGNPSSPNAPMEMSNLLAPHLNGPQRHQNKGNVSLVPHYTYKDLAFVEELGEGAFGKVYKGELKLKTGGRAYVAVKQLKENANAKTQADFQREIELISELKHPNIVCLLGVVLKQDPICMLFEYMSEGDLHEFLVANSPMQGEKGLSGNDLLQIALQIAQGMEYLSEQHYVHRDLAARNCLVARPLLVKISDFGLSRDMYSCDYYRVQSKSLLPVRWMPPEAILYGKFTAESDVWAYGVVLWEIFSYGLQPYYGHNNQEVINMIRSRKLLNKPDICPSHVYALMVECWAELAMRRPSFTEIAHRLHIWASEVQKTPDRGYGTSSRSPPHSHASSHQNHTPSPAPNVATPQIDPAHNETLRRISCGRLNESQISLASRCSSLGNKTQSTGVSVPNTPSIGAEHNHRLLPQTGGKKKRHISGGDDTLERSGGNHKNIVVNSCNGGENVQIRLTN